ncbi:MAG: hypothetical protein KC619_35375 [Myxococcales bacterium]|nr:hypothetical protein [Myxococcales bacterium]
MSDDHEGDAREGTRLMWSGAAIGVASAASAVVLGATCPLCVVGAPALVGWGAYKRWNAKKRLAEAAAREEAVEGG